MRRLFSSYGPRGMSKHSSYQMYFVNARRWRVRRFFSVISPGLLSVCSTIHMGFVCFHRENGLGFRRQTNGRVV